MGERRALLIGVSDYGEGLEPLPGSLQDVRAMAQVLAAEDCGAFDVKPLENCDRATLEAAVEQFFQGGDPEDLLLLYFSGHGDLGSGGIRHPQLHFCTHDSQKPQGRLIESSAVSATFLKRQMDLSRARQIVVILDCCYSGAIADLLKKGADDIDFSDLKAKGRVILASSSAAQMALQEKDGLSLYTRYLIEGMKGAAYPGNGAWIYARDLHAHAERRFEIERKGGSTPKILAEDTAYNLPIVRAPKPDAKQEYRKAVDRIFQNLDANLDLNFDGIIKNKLARGSLDTKREQLALPVEEATAIEAQVQQPYQARATQRRTYADYFRDATQEGYLPNDLDQVYLEDIRLNLGLGEADATKIRQILTQQLNLKPIPTSSPPSPPPSKAAPPPPPPQPAPPTFAFEVVTVDAQGKINSRQPATAEYRRETLPGDVTLDMVRIPAGEFMMGQTEAEKAELIRQVGEESYKKYYANELPRHSVAVPSFWMGKYAVTQAQWRVVAHLPKVKADLKPDPANFKGENRPVERVSWHDATEFCARLTKHTGRTYRLPSEAEWEYACRAGTTTPFYFGETITPDLVNYSGNYSYGAAPKGQYREATTDVGSFPPNGFGLYDMHGNVWEWCLDHWHDGYGGLFHKAPPDGSAWLSSDENKFLLRRGGSWVYGPRDCRCAFRNRLVPGGRNDNIGFRVVCSSAWALP
ncbi:MAG: SUMF1/EgtB/PvdO family nonheme iron enzyme [Leptolyngbyaceae cyanobacterium T60_A2020_046]|nr:SUMF1/EgtB/PvdO family nonheme iron enzyme [Leptolyngbyaceae cyanobacterium T60_A2020_046]